MHRAQSKTAVGNKKDQAMETDARRLVAPATRLRRTSLGDDVTREDMDTSPVQRGSALGDALYPPVGTESHAAHLLDELELGQANPVFLALLGSTMRRDPRRETVKHARRLP